MADRAPRFILAACVLCAAPLGAQPVRLSIDAFGTKAEVEVRDLRTDLGEQAAREALEEIFAIEVLSRPDGAAEGGLGRLNANAGGGLSEVDPRLLDMLARATQFCLWSEGAHGPLGGEVYRLWRQSQEERQGVEPAARRLAVASAACDRLRLHAGETPRVELGDGSRLELPGWAEGYAVDRAMDVLRRHGAGNALVKVGAIWRAIGRGAGGEGWYVALPAAQPGSAQPGDEVWLRDRALAVSSRERREGELFVPLLDQRTGRPGSGVLTVAVVSALAVDAVALADSLYVLGLRAGQRRLGLIEPDPAVYWLLGDGKGEPVGASYRWSEVPKVR